MGYLIVWKENFFSRLTWRFQEFSATSLLNTS